MATLPTCFGDWSHQSGSAVPEVQSVLSTGASLWEGLHRPVAASQVQGSHAGTHHAAPGAPPWGVSFSSPMNAGSVPRGGVKPARRARAWKPARGAERDLERPAVAPMLSDKIVANRPCPLRGAVPMKLLPQRPTLRLVPHLGRSPSGPGAASGGRASRLSFERSRPPQGWASSGQLCQYRPGEAGAGGPGGVARGPCGCRGRDATRGRGRDSRPGKGVQLLAPAPLRDRGRPLSGVGRQGRVDPPVRAGSAQGSPEMSRGLHGLALCFSAVCRARSAVGLGRGRPP